MNELHDALTDIAGRAHDPAPLAARIMTRSRRQRQRRGLLVAAAAGTVAAGGIAAWPRRTVEPDPPPLATTPGLPSPAPSAPTPSPSAVASRAVMLYRPTWMPTGYAEVSRWASAPGTGPTDQTRSYQRGDDGDQPIHLFLGARDQAAMAGARPATLGGRRAWLNQDADNPAQVWLEADDGLILTVSVHQEKDRAEIARHIAASIRPDGTSVCALSISFGWLPEAYRGTIRMGIDGTAGDHSQDLRAHEAGGKGREAVEVLLSSQRWPDRDAERITLLGRPGLLWPYQERPCPSEPSLDGTVSCGVRMAGAVVDLGDRRLHVRMMPWATKSRQDLIRVVNEITIGRAPDVSWMPR